MKLLVIEKGGIIEIPEKVGVACTAFLIPTSGNRASVKVTFLRLPVVGIF